MVQLRRTQGISDIRGSTFDFRTGHMSKVENRKSKTLKIKKMKQIIYLLSIVVICFACEPQEADDISLPALPEAPTFSMEISPDDPNTVIVKDNSTGFFDRTWEFEDGQPLFSKKQTETVFFSKAGEYKITLHASKEGGGGTSSTSQTISIAEDAAVTCTDEVTFLAGGCEENSIKCWTFSHVAAAITVGPTPGSSEWYTSPESGLVVEQYDDSFCYSFTDAHFDYRNNGLTVDPWDGYQAVEYTPPSDYTWFLNPGAGANGEMQIVLPEGAFMGVWDSGPLYDVVLLTETELVVRSRIVGADEGWFELYFVAL